MFCFIFIHYRVNSFGMNWLRITGSQFRSLRVLFWKRLLRTLATFFVSSVSASLLSSVLIYRKQSIENHALQVKSVNGNSPISRKLLIFGSNRVVHVCLSLDRDAVDRPEHGKDERCSEDSATCCSFLCRGQMSRNTFRSLLCLSITEQFALQGNNMMHG